MQFKPVLFKGQFYFENVDRKGAYKEPWNAARVTLRGICTVLSMFIAIQEKMNTK